MYPWECKYDHPLALHVQAAVPLNILALKERGGPDEDDIARTRQWALELAEKGDILLFGGDECAKLANEMCRCIAVLSFFPGGIQIFGCRFDAQVPPRQE